jgi:hypothetical protein
MKTHLNESILQFEVHFGRIGLFNHCLFYLTKGAVYVNLWYGSLGSLSYFCTILTGLLISFVQTRPIFL